MKTIVLSILLIIAAASGSKLAMSGNYWYTDDEAGELRRLQLRDDSTFIYEYNKNGDYTECAGHWEMVGSSIAISCEPLGTTKRKRNSTSGKTYTLKMISADTLMMDSTILVKRGK
jgi:hypothetical protein